MQVICKRYQEKARMMLKHQKRKKRKGQAQWKRQTSTGGVNRTCFNETGLRGLSAFRLSIIEVKNVKPIKKKGFYELEEGLIRKFDGCQHLNLLGIYNKYTCS